MRQAKENIISFLSLSPAAKLGIMMTCFVKKNKNITGKNKTWTDLFSVTYFLLVVTDWAFLNPQMATRENLNYT